MLQHARKLAFLAAVTFAHGAEPGQLDANAAMFSVMCALHAAGYNADMESPNNHPLRAAVAQHLGSRKLSTAVELKEWLQNRNLGPERLDLNRFISFALSVDGPPHFNYKFSPHELPPDVVPLEGLERLISRFHAEAGIDELYQRSQPAIEEMLKRYQEPVVQTLSQVNGYLRNPTSGYTGRRFFVYLELLAPPNHIQTRVYKDDFYLILTPSPETHNEYIRSAYLQYLLDPLTFKVAAQLEKKKPLIDLAQAAPALEEHYKQDFSLLTTASLIKAVEARLDKSKDPTQALREGFILTPYFYEALVKYEAQEASMRLYFPEMIAAIDLKKEDRRLSSVSFAAEKQQRAVKVAPQAPPPPLTGILKTLEDAEDLYRARKYDPARETFLRALQESSEKSLHAKSYYGLARIAALQKNPELAESLFQKVLELEPDSQTKAWSHVYLGRLADLANERETAQRQYQAALATQGASAAARKAAEQGLSQSFNTPKEK